MTQLRRILSFTFFVAALLVLPSPATAQVLVTPVVQHTPPGQLIVVNNDPGVNHTDPHVDGDLVCYTNQPNGSLSSIRYHNLVTGTDNTVPTAPGTLYFLCHVRGTMITFTRDSSEADIFSFDTALSTLTELDPTPGSMRFEAAIGDQTIAWQDFCVPACSATSSAIVAYDRTTLATTVISASPPAINQNPAISSDGSVVAWEGCTTVTSCAVWKAVRSSAGVWNAQQLLSPLFPVTGDPHPDTDGTVIAYASRASTASMAWQPVAGGTEQILNLPRSAINPSVSGGMIAFAYDATGSGSHQIVLYNVAANVLYKVTEDEFPGGADKTLNDISVTPDGKVRIVWQQEENSQANVYAYTFNLPVSVPFSKFRVRVEAELTRHHDRDKFEAEGQFELGKGSPGINPAQDSLHFSAMGGSTNIVFDVPLSSFHAGHHGRLRFYGVLNGFPVEIHIRPLHQPRFYEFTLEAHKMNLAHFSNPVDVTLQVGNNVGTAVIHADIDHEESDRRNR